MPEDAADSGRVTNRLFVPLKTEHWERFEKGTKKWELRGVNHQFKPETVFEGRAVELRRGYSTDDSLWGTIEEVRTFGSLPAIPREVRLGINPVVAPSEFVEHASDLLGDYEEFIAFRVSPLGGIALVCQYCGAAHADEEEHNEHVEKMHFSQVAREADSA